MLLLGVLIVTPSVVVLAIVLRCMIWMEAECWTRPWPTIFRDWLGETIPILVAIIMTGRTRPPPS
ncbi:MAG TPA: hypothetical protein VHT74_08425 [Acetobacteraceae bacterium]|nr:hypothetical protein [Acetobacteraceae bacterium]